MQRRVITNASTRFATFGILGFFWFTKLSGKFRLNLHDSKRVMQALCSFYERECCGKNSLFLTFGAFS
ncbi:hypothetical protein AYK60_01590 [Vibrio sp. SBT000027]|nr:hypothetical protein AYK60_01590 [Vibrio sp. SBT000027]